MKTKTTFVLIILFAIFSSFTVQDKITVIGEFDGAEDYGYNFIVLNSENEEKTLTFQEIDETILADFDLNSEALVGSKFEIVYTSAIEIVLDDDGFEEEVEILTIIGLKQLKK